MKYLERELLGELEKWIGRKEILAIKGPRQSGKTTLLKMLYDWLVGEKKAKEENIIYLTLEDRDILEKLTLNAKEFISSFIKNKNEKYYFLLDEFHYLEEGGQKLKLLYDTIDNTKFIITGSSSLEITALSKYLVGRTFSFYLMPFSFYEFLKMKDERSARIYKEKNSQVKNFILKNKNFKISKDVFIKDLSKRLEEFLIFGGYPEVVKTSDVETKKIILKNIYETYTNKDLIELLQIRDIFKFRNTARALALQIGGIINYNEIATLSNSYYKEVLQFLSTLQETYIIKLVSPFYKNLRTELRKNPKIYFIDLGLRNYIISNYNLLSIREDAGNLTENYVYLALFNILKDFGKINYWRTTGKAEVDFILNLGTEIIPIEVKFSEFKKANITRSLGSFINSYKPKRAIVFTKNLWAEKKVGRTTVKFIPLCYT